MNILNISEICFLSFYLYSTFDNKHEKYSAEKYGLWLERCEFWFFHKSLKYVLYSYLIRYKKLHIAESNKVKYLKIRIFAISLE